MKDYLEHLVARGQIAFNIRGSNWVQAFPAESEDDAYLRIRGKLSNISGAHLAQTTLNEPNAAAAAGGYTVPPPTPGVPVAPPPGGTLPGDETPPNPFAGGATPSSGGSGITAMVPTSLHNADPNSPLNLLGKIESWGVGGATKVKTIEISTEDFSGKQLQDLVRKLPEGKYGLKIEKEDEA